MTFPERKMPSLDALASYWAGRCLKCDSRYRDCVAGFEGHSDYLTFCDTGEPECVRCRAFLGYTPAVIRAAHKGESPECDCGNARECRALPPARAVRAHMVPRWRIQCGDASGFEVADVDAPVNITILCHNCHQIDPESATRQEHLAWMIAERERQAAARVALLSYPRLDDYDSPVLLALVTATLPDTASGPQRHECAKRIIDAVREWNDLYPIGAESPEARAA